MALSRSPATTTLYWSKCQRSWLCRPASSSTTSRVVLGSCLLMDVAESFLGRGEGEGETGALAGGAVHGESAVAGVDELSGLVDADAHALAGFGGDEGCEQVVADALGIHTDAVVLDFNDGIVALAAQSDVDTAAPRGRLVRILDAVSQNHDQSLLVGVDLEVGVH